MWKLSISNVKARDTAIPVLAKIDWSMGNVMGIDPYHRYGSLNPNPNPNPVHIGARLGLAAAPPAMGRSAAWQAVLAGRKLMHTLIRAGKRILHTSTTLRFYASTLLHPYASSMTTIVEARFSTLLRFCKPVWCPQPCRHPSSVQNAPLAPPGPQCSAQDRGLRSAGPEALRSSTCTGIAFAFAHGHTAIS